MGRFCQITGCNSNCDKENKSMFAFPLRNKRLLKKWLELIPGEINITSNTGICEDHFEKHFLVQKDSTKNGKIRKMLLRDAYPTIFTNYDPNFVSNSKKRNRKSSESEEFEHDDNCRFCLKKFYSDKTRIKIDDSITKIFRNITKLNLRTSSVYSKFVCVPCYRSLKQFNNFRDELIKNQFKLYRHLGALEDNDEELMGLEVEDDQEAIDYDPNENIEELTFDNESENEEGEAEYLNDDFVELLEDDPSTEIKPEDTECNESQIQNQSQVHFQLDISTLPIKIEHPAEEDYKSNEMLQGIYNSVKQERTENEEYSIFNLPTWDDINGLHPEQLPVETVTSERKYKKSTPRKKYQKSNKKSSATKKESDYRRPQVHIKYGSRLCPMCGKTFSGGRACRVHVERTHLKIKRYTCDVCGYRSYMKDHLKSHMTSHIKERTIPCDQCDRVFNRLQCLRVHIKSAHSNERTHICECGKSYKTHSALYTHMRYWHSDEKKFVCSICEYVAYDNNKLKDHMRIHADKPELKCPYCEEYFYTLVKLRLHKMTFHEEPKFTCEFCGQKFHLGSKLKIHMKSHLGQKDYACPYCEMRYFKNSALNRHIMHYHMKLKLKCEIHGCSSQFARKETYKNHVLSHHKDIGEENVQMLLNKIRDMKQPTESSIFKLNNLRGH